MLLKKILENINIKEINGNTDREILNISFDTRTVDENSVFVCIRGINTDRHEYVSDAIKKGCRAIVSEYPIGAFDGVNVVVENTNKALSLISSNFFGNPQKALKIIGITGTNGKTTTTTLLKKALDEQGYKVGLIGTNDIIIGDTVIPSDNTTPESPQLFSYFKKMVEYGCEFVVMEVSSHSVSLDRIYGINFLVGGFTNLTQDHLDYHKTMESYGEAKSRFFEACEVSVINNDDEYSELMKKSAKGKVATYSVEKSSEYRAENIIHNDDSVSYDLNGYHIDFPIPGGFSVYNSLCVYAVLNELGILPQKILKSLKGVHTVKGRCEIVELKAPFKVIIDYAHTPDGMENILKTVNEFKKERVITVFGCGGDRDKGKRPKMGKMAEKYSDVVVVTSDNPRSENPESIIDDIMEGFLKKEEVIREQDRYKAIKKAITIAKKDDIVLLLGKGHETVQKFKDYVIEFDERKIVREICDLL